MQEKSPLRDDLYYLRMKAFEGQNKIQKAEEALLKGIEICP